MTTPTAMCSPQSISMAQNKEIMHQSRASSKTFVFLQAPASCSAARDTKQKRRRKRTRRITRGLRRPADRLSPDVCHNRQGLSEVMGVKLCALRAEPRLENVIGALTPVVSYYDLNTIPAQNEIWRCGVSSRYSCSSSTTTQVHPV
ncbi:hypothetical protein V8E52_009954 [Russula decolorans]|jgi:hypothetical protein